MKREFHFGAATLTVEIPDEIAVCPWHVDLHFFPDSEEQALAALPCVDGGELNRSSGAKSLTADSEVGDRVKAQAWVYHPRTPAEVSHGHPWVTRLEELGLA